jgi:hypothetical protein
MGGLAALPNLEIPSKRLLSPLRRLFRWLREVWFWAGIPAKSFYGKHFVQAVNE